MPINPSTPPASTGMKFISDTLSKDKGVLTSFDDYDNRRQQIFDYSIDAVKQRFPLSNQRYTLELDNPSYKDTKRFSYKEQKEAILNNRSLTKKLQGNWTLRDNETGKVIDRTSKRTVLNVPYLTERGTFVRNGVEQSLINQFRLIPNVYSKVAGDGTYESHVNVRQGTGNSFKVSMNPKTAEFYIRSGGRKIKLYPVLQALGVQDSLLEDAWGPEILKRNRAGTTTQAVHSAIQTLIPKHMRMNKTAEVKMMGPEAGDIETLKQSFNAMELDPDATQTTLGAPHSNVGSGLFLDVTKKLLNISRGTAKSDDRDSMEFQRMYGPHNYFAERILKDPGNVLRNKLWKITNQGNLSSLQSGMLNKHVDSLFNTSGLSQMLEEINPLDALDQSYRVTRMGEGGISSLDAVPDEARAVQPTYRGYVDMVRSPECYDDKTEIKTSTGWKLFKDITMQDELACRIHDCVYYKTPEGLQSYDYDGLMIGCKKQVNFLVTPNHRMRVKTNGIGYVMTLAEDILGKGFNMEIDGGIIYILKNDTFEKEYKGVVYCATVQGGLVYVRRKGKAFWCGNSLRVGVDMKMAQGTQYGKDGKVYQKFLNTKTGKQEYVDSVTASRSIVAFPESFKYKGKFIPAMVKGEGIKYVPRTSVDYMINSGSDLFSTGANLVPMASGIKAMRLLMGSKMHNQALPLTNREAPLVRTRIGTKDIYDYISPHMGRITSEKDGIVKSISKDKITTQNDDGTTSSYDTYDNFPFSRKTSVRTIPFVKGAQRVKKGQAIAGSNFTDDKGTAALGLNLRVAYMPYKGAVHEDAIVISESAAKKLNSEHMYANKLREESGVEVLKDKYTAMFPGTFTAEQFKTIGKEGTVKPGTLVRQGDPLILSTKTRQPGPGTMGRRLTRDSSVKWEHEDPGVVTDVVKNKEGWKVYVRANATTKRGDKLANFYGGKGVVGDIIPDNKMIHDKDGKPYEIILNPVGVISRTNSSQLIESSLGKVATKTGKPYILPSFTDDPDESFIDLAQTELKKHGLSDTDDIYDPTTGRKIPKVFNGVSHFFKLQHTAEAKSGGKSFSGYTMDEQPSTGGGKSKRIGCFPAGQKIKTIHGEIQIGRLVEKRFAEQVWTFDEDKEEWTFKPITDWFTYRAKIEDILCVEVSGIPCETGDRKIKYTSCLYPTKNHKVYTFDGCELLAGDLTVDDKLISWGPLVTKDQLDVLYGGMLGDSYFNSVIQIMHSTKQIEYMDFKQKVLAGLMAYRSDCKPSFLKRTGKSYGRGLVTMPTAYVVDQMKAVCLKDGKKHVTEEWLSHVDELGICMWVLDDGSISNRSKVKGGVALQGAIATHGFTYEEVVLLHRWLGNKLNISSLKIYKASGREEEWFIYLTAESCWILIDMLARNVPASIIPKTKKKLKKLVAERQLVNPPRKLDIVNRMGKVPVSIKDIRPYKHDKPGIDEINVYDFTVDKTHSYTAGGVLVSNSMEIAALVSHGAKEIMKDAKLIRGSKNDDYWRDLKMGRTPTVPDESFIYKKFLAMIQAAGVNIHKDKNKLNIFAMTNENAKELTGTRQIQTADTFDPKQFKPVKGGLFDETLTGGAEGNRFSYIKLDEPVPNPVMEDFLRRILNLKQKEYTDLLAGRKEYKGVKGGKAMYKMLSEIDVDQETRSALNDVKTASASRRDNAVKRLRALQSMKEHKVSPTEFMLTRVPVLPPKFRPIVVTDDMNMSSDFNILYRELLHSRNDLRDAKTTLPDEYLPEVRERLYNSFKAISGLGDPDSVELQEKRVGGLLKTIFGKGSPKHGMMQRRMVGGAVDLSSRAVVTPNPSLKLNQVGLPENRAWELYEPFVIRHMVRGGYKATEAAKSVSERKGDALVALRAVMEERPILMNRAPTMHKWSILAANPILTKGDTLQVPPHIVKGFNLDFDGDTMTIHVPSSAKAVAEARDKMMPEKILFGARDFNLMYKPDQEYVQGAHLATKTPLKGTPVVFETEADAVKAYKTGKIDIDTPVKIRKRGV